MIGIEEEEVEWEKLNSVENKAGERTIHYNENSNIDFQSDDSA